MRKVKLLALCMSAILAVPMICGCGEKKDASNDEQDGGKKDVHISMLLRDVATSPYSKDWKVLDWIKEETGVTFDMQAVPSAGWDTKVNMIFNSGNIPDIVTQQFPDVKRALSGQLLPINKYMDKLPNLQKFLKDNDLEDRWNELKYADGNIYMIPGQLHPFALQTHQWCIRKDIFEKNNLPIPKTMEEVYEVGKKLKEIYPDSTPMTNRLTSTNLLGGVSAAYKTIVCGGQGDGAYYNQDTKKYEFGPISSGWKEMATLVHNMYKDGVLDQEYATLDAAVYEQKVVQGSTFIVFDYIKNIEKFVTEGKKIDPDYELELITPPTGYEGCYAVPPANPWTKPMLLPASLADDPKHLDEVLAYLNWGFSDEAATLCTFGKEGETYEVKDGIKKFTHPFKESQNNYGLAMAAFLVREDMDVYYSQFSKEQSKLLDKICKECVPKPLPTTPFTEDKLDGIQIYQTTLRDYTNSMIEKFINGSEPLSNWDNFVQQCKAKGCDKLIDEYNKALKEKK